MLFSFRELFQFMHEFIKIRRHNNNAMRRYYIQKKEFLRL